ncbi:MAG: cupin domain-containing protein [Methanomicrobiaceae archaeon]|nr:cupin domain-containing protein [Methanomicrobiaceae archaeon]
MYRILSIFLIFICLSAGCITDNSEINTGQVNDSKSTQQISLITPGGDLSIYNGQVVYNGLIGADVPEFFSNYSTGYITIKTGNATPLHMLLNRSEFIFIIKGEAEILCDDSLVNAKTGEGIILPKDVLQSVKSTGEEDLCYINVVSPGYSAESEVLGEELSCLNITTKSNPVIISSPTKGIEWDIGSDMMIYSIANPVLMPDVNIPFEYSIAYAEILPGGVAEDNCLKGLSELIVVIEGKIEVYAPGGDPVLVSSGNAAYMPANQEKGYRNRGESVAKILSFTDPAWTPEIWESV